MIASTLSPSFFPSDAHPLNCPIFVQVSSPHVPNKYCPIFSSSNRLQPEISRFTDSLLSSQPTMLENFSRTVRNYVPTSIPVPTDTPSPPRVSRPVSFGNFMGTNLGHSPSHSSERDSSTGTPSSDRHRARQSPNQPLSRVRGSVVDSPEVILGSEDVDVAHGNHLLTAYPTVAEGDSVLWSRWDSLPQLGSKPR